MLPVRLPRLIKTICTNDGHGEEVIGRAEAAGWDIALFGGDRFVSFLLLMYGWMDGCVYVAFSSFLFGSLMAAAGCFFGCGI